MSIYAFWHYTKILLHTEYFALSLFSQIEKYILFTHKCHVASSHEPAPSALVNQKFHSSTATISAVVFGRYVGQTADRWTPDKTLRSMLLH